VSRRTDTEAMLRRYGEPASAGGTEFPAVIRPLRFDGSLEGACGDFLCTAPAFPGLTPGDAVVTAHGSYFVRRSETVPIGGEALYCRAVLRSAPAENAVIETDAGILARAESCKASLSAACSAPVPWGATAPAAVAGGAVSYELELSGVEPENGADLAALGEFRVVLRHSGKTETFTGCRWKKIEEAAGPFSSPPNLTAIAAGRNVTE
jgi:hypothetical protein